MSITTYAELKTAVANWLARSDLTSYIPDFIRLAEVRIYDEVKHIDMETALSDTIASGVIAVPSGYRSMVDMYVETTPIQFLLRKPSRWIYEKYPTRSATSTPLYFARERTNFIFGPYPDSGYTVKGTYIKTLEALSDSNTTNWLTDERPDLILYGSLIAAEPFLKNDARLAMWEAMYMKAKAAANKAYESERYSGSVLQTTVG